MDSLEMLTKLNCARQEIRARRAAELALLPNLADWITDKEWGAKMRREGKRGNRGKSKKSARNTGST